MCMAFINININNIWLFHSLSIYWYIIISNDMWDVGQGGNSTFWYWKMFLNAKLRIYWSFRPCWRLGQQYSQTQDLICDAQQHADICNFLETLFDQFKNPHYHITTLLPPWRATKTAASSAPAHRAMRSAAGAQCGQLIMWFRGVTRVTMGHSSLTITLNSSKLAPSNAWPA